MNLEDGKIAMKSLGTWNSFLGWFLTGRRSEGTNMEYQTEVWKVIPGYEGFYEASSLGRIRSVDRNSPYTRYKPSGHVAFQRGKIRSQRVSKKDGRFYVDLSKDGRRTQCQVQVLILSAFSGVRPEGMQCRHLNGVRTDNRIDNLAWGTVKENAGDKRTHGTLLLGESHPLAKLTSEVAVLIAKSNDLHSVLSTRFGVSVGTIQSVKSGRTWSHATGIRR